jgi:hypothetical protein
MPVFIIWISLGIVCAVIAHNKGLKPLTWGVLGSFLGIFALIMIMFVPNEKKKCPMCANEAKNEALICHYCGYDFVNEKMPYHT